MRSLKSPQSTVHYIMEIKSRALPTQARTNLEFFFELVLLEFELETSLSIAYSANRCTTDIVDVIVFEHIDACVYVCTCIYTPVFRWGWQRLGTSKLQIYLSLPPLASIFPYTSYFYTFFNICFTYIFRLIYKKIIFISSLSWPFLKCS